MPESYFKKMRQLILITLFVSLSFGNIIFAQTAPTYSNEFLALGVGARAFAMGNAVVASQKNADAAYWNPSKLLQNTNTYDISAMHSSFFGGLSAYDYLGFSMRLNNGSAVGANLIRFGVDDIPNTLELVDKDGNFRYDLIQHFSVADYALLLSYAKQTKIKGLDIGANIKLIYRHTGDFATAYGFGFDIAANYQWKQWRFAAMLRDAVGTFNSWVFQTEKLRKVFELTGNKIPENSTEITLPRLILGASKQFSLTDKINLLAELDIDLTFDGKRNVLIRSKSINVDPHIGIEASYNQLVYLRMGLNNFQQETDFNQSKIWTFQPNLGLGIQYKNFRLDYALTDIGNQSIARYSNIFSLGYSF